MDLRERHGREACIRCGRPLPDKRKALCYVCRPKREYDTAPAKFRRPRPAYSYEERAAQAEARGLSYGKLMWLLENNQPLPPLLKSVRWPIGSKHDGEEQLEE